MTIKLWRIALACFLLLYAVFAITNIKIDFGPFLMALLAIGSAVLLLFDK